MIDFNLILTGIALRNYHSCLKGKHLIIFMSISDSIIGFILKYIVYTTYIAE